MAHPASHRRQVIPVIEYGDTGFENFITFRKI